MVQNFKALGKVEHRATKMVHGLRNVPYQEHLKRLELSCLDLQAGLDLSFAGSQGEYNCMWRCLRPGRIFPNSVTRVVPGLSGRSCQPIRDETPSVTSLLAQQHGARQAIAAVGVMMRWLTT